MIGGNFGGRNVLPYASPGWQAALAAQTVNNQGNILVYCPLNYADYGFWGSEANSEYLDTVFPGSNPCHLVPTGGVTIGTNGIGDSAVSFDGTTGFLSSASTTNLPTGSTNRTFCCWMQTPSVSARRGLISYGNVSVGQLWECSISAGNSDVTGTTAGNVFFGSATVHVWSAGVIPLNQPVHVAMSSGANSSGVQIWINGVPQSLSNDGSTAIATSGNQVGISARPSGSPIWGSQLVWDWRMYSGVILTTGDILDIYSQGLANRFFAPSQYSMEMPALKSIATTTAFRKTLSGIGGRTGTRQIQGWGM